MTVVGDTFTDADGTELASHTPTGPYAGGTWTGWYIPGASRLKIASNRVYSSTSTAVATTAEYHHSQSLTDGYIEADFVKIDASGYALIGFRHVGTSTADPNWDAYRAVLTGSTGVLELSTLKAGTLGSYTISPFPTGTYVIRLKIVGSSLKVYVDGVERISVTDSSIAAGGVALVQINSPDGTSAFRGIQIDNIVMSDARAVVPALVRRRWLGLYTR